MFMVDRHRRYSFYQGETGIIKGFIDREGNIEIYIDSWDRTHNFDQDVLKILRVVSGDEAAQLRAKVPLKGSTVVLLEDRHKARALYQGETGIVQGVHPDGDFDIYMDSWDCSFKCGRDILKILRVVSGDEAEKLKAKVPRKGSKVVFHTASTDGKIQPGYTGTIQYFDSDGNPQIHIDIRGEVLNCARSILQKLKIDVELEEKRREEKRKEEERRVAAERAAERQRQQVIINFINCTL